MLKQQKNKWKRPKFIALIRKREEECVLSPCKWHAGSQAMVISSASSWDNCTITWQVSCVVCSTDSSS